MAEVYASNEDNSAEGCYICIRFHQWRPLSAHLSSTVPPVLTRNAEGYKRDGMQLFDAVGRG